jgi:hypothetical protein
MSGFTSFLKKFGLDAVKIAENIMGAPTVVIQDLAQGGGDIKALFDLVKMSERMWAASSVTGQLGSQKIAAIQPDVTAIVSDVEVLAGTKIGSIIKDQASFNEGMVDLSNALVKILNACGD